MKTTKRWMKVVALGAAGTAMLSGGLMSLHQARSDETSQDKTAQKNGANDKVVKTEAEWKRILTPMQFYVLRKQGTERAGTGALLNNHAKGIYRCAGCGKELFSSATKFESGTGWPSFYAPLPGGVETRPDNSDGDTRIEVLCSRCGGHLGHVFDDGPRPTGLRYCMNSAALKFEKQP